MFVYLLWAFFVLCHVCRKKEGKKTQIQCRGRVREMIRLGVRQLYIEAHDMGTFLHAHTQTHRPSA